MKEGIILSSTCSVCKSEASIRMRLTNDVYYCKKCDLFFAPDVRFNHSFISELDETTRYKALESLRYSNFSIIIDRLKKTTEKSGQVAGLEVGNGYGWFLDIAKKNGIDCVGIEPEEEMFNFCVSKGHQMVRGFFPNDLVNEELYDFIIFNDVLEHIPDINFVVENCYKRLKDGGYVIVNIPLHTGFFYRMGSVFYKLGITSFMNRLWQFNFHSPHFYYFNNKSLIKVFEKNNFNLVDYHKLESIDSTDIKSRILMDNSLKKYANIISPLIKISLLIKGIFPEDIGCFYFKKNS